MECEQCGQRIMKGDYFCAACGYPNPRHEETEARIKKAILGVARSVGSLTENPKPLWEAFKKQMWPRE